MLKVNSIIPKTVKRYSLKNTISGKYNRSKDVATISTLATTVQIGRIPFWGLHDIGLTAVLATITLGSIKNLMNIRTSLQPIVERAKAIKKASKSNS